MNFVLKEVMIKYTRRKNFMLPLTTIEESNRLNFGNQYSNFKFGLGDNADIITFNCRVGKDIQLENYYQFC